jgi:hypothetical protein
VSLSDRVAALTTRVAQEVKAIRALRSVANGLAALDATGKLPVDQLPAVITAATRLQVLSTADISLTGTTSPFAIGVEQSGQQIIADNNEVFVRTWNAVTSTYDLAGWSLNASYIAAIANAAGVNDFRLSGTQGTRTDNAVRRDYADAYGVGRPACALWRVASANIATGADTAITWGGKDLDTDGMWTSGTGITIKTAGVWLFIVHSQWGAPASNTERCTWLVKNASNNAGAGMAQDSRPGTFGTSGQTIMAADRCVANDVIRAGVYQNHGATVAWCPTNKPSRFFAFWLGP